MKHASTVIEEIIDFHVEQLVHNMIGAAESEGSRHIHYRFTNVRESEYVILKNFLEDNGCDISRIDEGLISFTKHIIEELKNAYFDESTKSKCAIKKVSDIIEQRIITLMHGDSPNPFHIEVPLVEASDVQAAVDEFNANGYEIKHLKLADGIFSINIGIFGKNQQTGKFSHD